MSSPKLTIKSPTTTMASTGRTSYVKETSPTSPLSPSTTASARKNDAANKIVLPPMMNKNNKIVEVEQQKTKATSNTSSSSSPPKTQSPRNQQSSPKSNVVIPSPPSSNTNNNNKNHKNNQSLISTFSQNAADIPSSPASSSSTTSHPNNNNNNTNNINKKSNSLSQKRIVSEKIPQVRVLIREKKEYKKAIELLDDLIGAPTYSDLPMFDEKHPDPPQYDNKVLFELLALRIEAWMSLHQYGRVLDDISNAMRVDLQSALLRAEFVIPKLKSLYDLGDISIGLQVATSLEIAVARNGQLLEEVLDWKRKFVLSNRKKNEVVESNHHGIVIGGRRFAAGAPLCRHGCPDKEPASFFQMEIVYYQMHCHDPFVSLYRLYTEFEGAKLAWKHWARQELRKAIDAAANENWKSCRDATRQYLIATELADKNNGENFVDAMDTLGRVPNPIHVETTSRFFKNYDRAMTNVDDLVELLVEISKPFCSCMNEIYELRSRRVKTVSTTKIMNNINANSDGNNNTTTETGKTRRGLTVTMNNNNNNNNNTNGVDDGLNNINMIQQTTTTTTTAVVPTVPNPAVSAQLMKAKANIREAANLREEGNLLFLARKFRSALKCYDEAIELDQSNTELLFNRTAALFELEQYDAVVTACDRTSEHAAQFQTSDRALSAKILARRADALWKLGALDEALLNYQESLDSWDSPSIRTKMIDCSIEMQKKKLSITHQLQSNNHNHNNTNEQHQQEKHEEGNSSTTKISPAPFFASCVIVEPISSRNIGKTGHLSLTVFPTQIATASPFFADSIPIPMLKFAGLPFAVVPCSASALTEQQNLLSQENNNNTTTTSNNNNNNNPNLITTSMNNAATNFNQSNTTQSENFFATLATRSLTIDLSDLPLNSAHHRADLWSNCGSVIVLRKDFQPVTCGQVVNFFQLLLDLWGLNSSPDDVDEQKSAKKSRLEIFSDVEESRKKIVEYLGANVVATATETQEQQQQSEQKNNNNNNNNNNEDSQLLPGTHVINTFSEKDKLVKQSKESNLQQAKMLKNQGNKLYKARRFRTALLRYDEGLLLDPLNPELLYNRAAALIELQMYDIAIDSCNRAADAANNARPGDSAIQDKIRARKNLALQKLGKYDEIEMLGSQPESSVMKQDHELLMSNNNTHDNDDDENEMGNQNIEDDDN